MYLVHFYSESRNTSKRFSLSEDMALAIERWFEVHPKGYVKVYKYV